MRRGVQEIVKFSAARGTEGEAEDGRSFLEKIVHLVVMVPQPEPFQLRHWFAEELPKLSEPRNEPESRRVQSIVDMEGGRQLATPRAVIRVLDALRFFWPPLEQDRLDFADLVWLTLIKNGNPALYRWIETYCATASLVSLGTARIEDTERQSKMAALMAAVGVGWFADPFYRLHFEAQLPGLRANHSRSSTSEFELYQPVNNDKRNGVLRRENVDPFLSYSRILELLTSIANRPGTTEVIERARQLASMFKGSDAT